MTRKWPIVAVLLFSPVLSRAIPACPTSWNYWNPFFASQSEREKAKWPDEWEEVTDKTSPKVLYEMSQALYEQCPRNETVNAKLENTAQVFLNVTDEDDPAGAAKRQQCYFWLGMAHGADAELYERQDSHAVAALRNFILLTDEGLRSQSKEQVGALRLRSARKLAFTAHNVQVIARNRQPGWQGASQRVRCFLTTYADTTGDKIVRGYLNDLNDWTKDFIHDFESEPRYDLAGMRILTAELTSALAAPKAPENRWPTREDINPADPNNPRNCYALASPIPGPEKFDFNFSKEAVALKELEKKTNERRKALATKAQKNAASVLDSRLP